MKPKRQCKRQYSCDYTTTQTNTQPFLAFSVVSVSRLSLPPSHTHTHTHTHTRACTLTCCLVLGDGPKQPRRRHLRHVCVCVFVFERLCKGERERFEWGGWVWFWQCFGFLFSFFLVLVFLPGRESRGGSCRLDAYGRKFCASCRLLFMLFRTLWPPATFQNRMLRQKESEVRAGSEQSEKVNESRK